MNQTGEIISVIRQNKGYSQKYVSNGVITQGAFSKFETSKTGIGLATFDHILTRLEISYEELKYIQNGYKYNVRDQFMNKLFNLSFNDKEVLQDLLEETNIYIKHQEDILVEDISRICEALILLSETNDIEKSRTPLKEVWERLSKRDLFYLSDLYFINTILFLFPLDSALEIKKFAFRSIEKYKNFQKVERLKINISINIVLLLMKDQRFEEAIIENEEAINLCKKHSDHLRLAICYIRKGICLNHLNLSGHELINKGKNILNVVEEFKLLHILEKEIERYNLTKK